MCFILGNGFDIKSSLSNQYAGFELHVCVLNDRLYC